MNEQHLATAPRLPVELARGGLGSLRKRGPYEGARLPDERLVLRAATVDAAKLRAYARICGYAGGTAELPPAYPHLLGFPLQMRLMARRDFPFPLLGLVHTDIELSCRRAVRADERPDIAVRLEEPRAHRKGTAFGVTTEAYIGGEPVWHSRSTYLSRHPTDAGAERSAGPAAPAESPPPRATWELPTGLGRSYAAASGDRNPIHLHPLTARLFGFPRHIAHGMWTFARCLAESGPTAGQLTARARFKAPVLLPSTVTFHSSAAEGAASGTVDFEVRGGKDGSRVHLTGSLHRGEQPGRTGTTDRL